MPTKVFASADYAFVSSEGFFGTDVEGAAAQIVAVEGTANWTQSAENPMFPGSVSILVQGTLIDDASVPPVITMTNVHVAYDWSMSIGAGPASSDSIMGEDYLASNIPSATKLLPAIGSASGSESADVTDLVTIFGGVTRADLFAKPIAWVLNTGWVPFVSHTIGVSFTNYVVTVTYTVPSSVISVNPRRGFVSGGQTAVVTGTGFLAATGVEFGGVAVASFVIDSDTQITVVTPEHDLGVVDVDVLSVATGNDLYEYIFEFFINLPQLPVRTPIQQGGPRRGR